MNVDFEAVFKISPAPMMILDRDLNFVAANPAYLEMVNKSEDDLISVYVFDAFPESKDRVESMSEVFHSGLRGEEPTISEIPFKILIDGVVTEQWWTAWHCRLEGTTGGEYVIQFSENVTDQVRIREMQDAMMAEMQHRVGNIFAVVGATARGAAATASDLSSFMDEFEDRLDAFVRVNLKLTSAANGEDTIASIVDFQLNAHALDAMDRLTVDGQNILLPAMQAQALSMAVHELATNSLKYGALGKPKGRLAIGWKTLPGGGGRFHWSETDIVIPHSKRDEGYGAILLDKIIPRQLNGAATREFGPNDFTYTLEIGDAG